MSVLPFSQNSTQLITANVFSRLGTWMSFIAVLTFIQIELAQTLSLILVIICKRLPSSIAFFFSGGLADRYNPKRIIQFSNFALFAVTLFLFQVDYGEKTFFPILIGAYILISLLEGISKPSLPAWNARLHLDSKTVERTHSSICVGNMLSVIASGVLSALLYSWQGIESVFIASLACYGISLLFFGATTSPSPIRPQKNRGTISPTAVLSQMGKNEVFVFGMTFGLALVFSYLSVIVTKFPFEVYGNREWGVAAINGILAISVFASAILYRFSSKNNSFDLKRTFQKVCFFLVWMIFFLIQFSRTEDFSTAMVFLFLFVMAYGYLRVFTENRLLIGIESAFTGRAFALLYLFNEMVLSAALILIGTLPEPIPIQEVGLEMGTALSLFFGFGILAYLAIRIQSSLSTSPTPRPSDLI